MPAFVLPINATAAIFAIVVTLYFWWENIKGIPGIEREGAAHHVGHHRHGGGDDRLVHLHALGSRRAPAAVADTCRTSSIREDALGWLYGQQLCRTRSGSIGILIGLGHSVLAMSGEETLAQVYREIEHPKLKNLEKAGLVIFVYSLVFTAGVSFFAVMIIPDTVRVKYFRTI